MAQKKKASKKAQSAGASLEKWGRAEIKQLTAAVAKLQKDLETLFGSAASRAKPTVKRVAKKASRAVGTKKAAAKRVVRAKTAAAKRTVAAKKPAVKRKPASRPARKPTAGS